MLFALVSLTACEGKKDDSASKDDTSSASSVEEKTTVKTVSEGKLTMATNAYFQPYEYYDGDKIVGIDAEIAAAIAEKLGLELVIEDMAFDSIITAVQEGSVDFGMAGMTVREDRLEKVDFTTSYANGKQVVIVKENSAIADVEDLFADGATWKAGVQLGTTGDIYATGDLGEDRVTQYNNANNAVLALIEGDVDCVIIDNEPAKALVAANAGLKILETTYADEDYAACISKENKALLKAIDDAIFELTEDGTIEAIIDKYIK
jgi:polar amino acid transport system substrate-binding protein